MDQTDGWVDLEIARQAVKKKKNYYQLPLLITANQDYHNPVQPN